MGKMSKKTEMGGFSWVRALLLSAAVAAGCGGVIGESSGGESHFLRHCDDSCEDGLRCISGLCTRSCLVSESDCSDLHAEAACTAESIEPGEVAVCDVACSKDVDCAELGAGFGCDGGFCRAADTSVSSGGSASTSTSSTSAGGSGGTGGSTGVDGGVGGFDSYCADCDQVYECPEDVTSDPITVVGSYFVGKQIKLFTKHSGGCASHSYSLCYQPGFLESYPVQGSLVLVHNANGDACEAELGANLTFDLTPYANLYEDSYGGEGGIIRTNFGTFAWGESCEDRVQAATTQAEQVAQLSLTQLLAAPVCTTDADCTWASIETRCAPSCGAMVSVPYQSDFEQRLELIDDVVCGDFEADGCERAGQPPCPAPPIDRRCVDNQCVIEE
jgi:hypothetical protein